jgi:hypothetical protein
MLHRKIFSGRIDSDTSGGALNYQLDPSPGGRACKVVLYSVKCVQKSGNNVRINLSLRTGPDGDVFGEERTLVTTWDPGTAQPAVKEAASGTPDTDATDVLGEWLRVSVGVQDSAASAAQWAQIEIWETRKPF